MPRIKNGKRFARKKRPKEKDVPANYDSHLEYDLHTTILKDWKLHADTVDYTVDHVYHPDFIREIEGKVILLEVKGRFWDFAEYSKYIWINKKLIESGSNRELVFLFANPNAPMPGATRRKDGTKRSHGEWATKNGIRWFSRDTIPDSWIDADGSEL